MNSEQRPLALRFPLHGSRLIEASAGTGKTWTISALYLRLILGHGGADAGLGRELLPPDILVVTYTEAATRELRDRIRQRLVQAAAAFRDEAEEADALLLALRADFEPAAWPACARRLDIAAQWMDQAAVSTIHSWCQRMLREHAFDSGSLFTQTLETDHSELFLEVVRDYWRRHCYPLQGDTLGWVNAHWITPDSLVRKIRLALADAPASPTVDIGSVIAPVLHQRAEQLAQLKAPWSGWLDEVEALLDAAVAQKQVNGRKLQARHYKAWLGLLRVWASDPALEKPGLSDSAQHRLSPEGLAEAWKSGAPPQHPAFAALALLPEQLAGLPEPAWAALQHAAGWVQGEFEAAKRRRAEMGFDDMLSRLDSALQGANGERLAQVIRQQFPVALIDEFQDTDPVQYRIFDAVYQVAANNRDCGLFLIGDPKQAIYSFRGADIYTYLQARRDTTGRHEHLGTNFRSSQAMVAAVNTLFGSAEPRPGGAFALATENENPLPFAGVAAQGRGECWQVNGQAAPALTAWQLDVGESLGAPAYTRSMAQRCASEMVRLLSLGQQGQAGFAGPDGHWQKVRPADMAVLVRNFREAQAIRAELSARGVKSVYLSDKDSVLASPEAADLLRWLRACAAPDDDRLLRAALASPTLAQPWALLDQLNQDEREWEERVLQFRGYRNLWLRQGVLPMLQVLLHDFDVPAQLLASDDGERRLTNLLHLAELLQQTSRELDGEQALIRHLDDQVQGRAAGNGDDQVLRLESDAELVKVVTIHKSKGLEYPLVFLPFISNARLEEGKGKPLRVRENGTHRLVMSATEPDLVLADRERMAEDVRLLYVAITRARHACWLGLTDLVRGAGNRPVLHLSAIGRLLSGGEAIQTAADLARHLAPWEAFEGVAVTDAPAVAHVRFTPEESGLPDLQARTPVRAAAEHWWIASYSALRMDSQAASRQGSQLRTDDAGPESAAAAKASDDERHAVFLPLRPGETPTIHRFPRGPGPGTFLHGLLELAAREGFGTLADPATCAEWLRPRCLRRGLGEWVETLGLWLSELLVREWPLPGSPGLSLAGLPPAAFQPELEFLFAASCVRVVEVDALIQQYILPGRPRPPALDDQLNGLLKGYIDLVLEHEGRYYVVDYKSNWLGADAAAYHVEAMEEAMLEHRYDLQFTLYLLALHRQLKARLPGYDYDRHIGGAVYWFVRGSADGGAGIWQQRPPRALIETLDRQFAGEDPLSVPLPASNPTREPV